MTTVTTGTSVNFCLTIKYTEVTPHSAGSAIANFRVLLVYDFLQARCLPITQPTESKHCLEY